MSRARVKVKKDKTPRCRFRWGRTCDHKVMKKEFDRGKCPFHESFSGKSCEGYKG